MIIITLSSYLVCLNCNDAISASAWVMIECHTHSRARGRNPFFLCLWINLEDMGVNGKHSSLPMNRNKVVCHTFEQHVAYFGRLLI